MNSTKFESIRLTIILRGFERKTITFSYLVLESEKLRAFTKQLHSSILKDTSLLYVSFKPST